MGSRFTSRRPGAQTTECRQCGALAADGAQISTRSLCIDCAIENVRAPARQLQEREGPAYEQWLASMTEALGRLNARR